MKRLLSAGAAVTLSLVALFAFPAAAQAHDELQSTVPANNAVLSQAPKQLVLTFEAAPLKDTTKIAASSTSGTDVNLPEPKASGATVTVAWPTGTPAGEYVVSWRNVGADGHPLSGQFGFGYSGTTGSAGPSQTPTVTTSPAADATSASTSNTSWLLPTLGGVLIVVVIIVGLAIRRNISKDAD
ncbi:MAG: copper resistance CopC family protein [Candidatus Nanopelagicales bacterium]